MYSIILTMFLIFSVIKCMNTDNIDRTRPFGTDSIKNNKYAKNLVGEDYGVGTFWGKPDKNDKIIDHLNKIQWLNNSFKQDVIWRRSIIIGVFTGILIALCIDIDIILNQPSKLLFIIITIFMVSYFSLNYYNRHFLWRRSKFVNTHIRKIKSNLKLPLYNKIDENKLI